MDVSGSDHGHDSILPALLSAPWLGAATQLITASAGTREDARERATIPLFERVVAAL